MVYDDRFLTRCTAHKAHELRSNYFWDPITMGVQYALHCAACGYSNPHCCGGVESGMAVTLSTVLCSACKQLYDVPIFKHGFVVAEIPMRCPKNKRHSVLPWEQPGPCPKCGAVLTTLGESALWD
jgi:hypothetical protein